jgi:hypothetical protein
MFKTLVIVGAVLALAPAVARAQQAPAPGHETAGGHEPAEGSGGTDLKGREPAVPHHVHARATPVTHENTGAAAHSDLKGKRTSYHHTRVRQPATPVTHESSGSPESAIQSGSSVR